MPRTSHHFGSVPSMAAPETRPHVLAVPFYLPGHEIPLLHLCQHLDSSGKCRISLLQAPRSKRFAPNKSPSSSSSPFLTLHMLPEHLLPEVNNFQDFRLYYDAFEQLGDTIVQEWKHRQLTCIITDVFVSWGKYVAEALSIPWIALWTSTTIELAVYFNIPKSISPNCIKGTDSFVSSISIPGLPEITASDYATIEHYQNPEQVFTKFITDSFARKIGLTVHADRVLVNTAEALERNAVDYLKQSGVNVVPVGPLHLLSKHREDKTENDADDDPNKVLPWLDQQQDSSVLFIAFGTTVGVPPGQIQEIASALESLKDLRFLWVVRPSEHIQQIPSGFSSIACFSTREKDMNQMPEDPENELQSLRGVVTDWVPQRRVLKHRAVSGFLTHCGWNSVLESITSGIPMIARPLNTDQVLTSKFLEEQWGVGVRIKGFTDHSNVIGKKEIEDTIEEYQLSGDTLRKNAQELRELVNEEMEPDKGASWVNLDSIIKDLHSRT